MSDPEVLGLNEQAALGVARRPKRSQFSHLLRHFLERFFNHETASPDGDAKARMVLIACAAGLPPFVVAIYLWPVYHAFIRVSVPGDEAIVPGLPPYWVQVNHHLFFVVYSFVAMGIATVFQWDLFFSDLLDVLVLNTLPIPYRRLFFARITAIAVLFAGFLFDANILATIALPEAIAPPQHAASSGRARAGGGSERALCRCFHSCVARCAALHFRRTVVSQDFAVSAGRDSGRAPADAALVSRLLRRDGGRAWFRRQCGMVVSAFLVCWHLSAAMEGPSALPIYAQLVQFGCELTLGTIALAVLVYPLAYRRRVHQLVEGANARSRRNLTVRSLHKLLHVSVLRGGARAGASGRDSRGDSRGDRHRAIVDDRWIACGLHLVRQPAGELDFPQCTWSAAAVCNGSGDVFRGAHLGLCMERDCHIGRSRRVPGDRSFRIAHAAGDCGAVASGGGFVRGSCGRFFPQRDHCRLYGGAATGATELGLYDS